VKKIGQFEAALAKLHGVIDTLERNWAESRERWDDETSRSLEKNHMDPLLQGLRDVIESTVPVKDCMSQAQRACQPPNEAR
jgi:hypothetical protein